MTDWASVETRAVTGHDDRSMTTRREATPFLTIMSLKKRVASRLAAEDHLEGP